MSENKFPDPYALEEVDAHDILNELQDILWAGEDNQPDLDKVWDSETLTAIARALEPLRPRPPNGTKRHMVFRVELLVDPMMWPNVLSGDLGTLLVLDHTAGQKDPSCAVKVQLQGHVAVPSTELGARLKTMGYPEDHFKEPK